MPKELTISDGVIFRQEAKYNANLVGPPIPNVKVFDCGFAADQSEYDWTEEEDNGTTIAHSSVDGGAVTITASGTNDDCGELAHTAQWSAASNCGMLAKVKISAITAVNVCIGFVDAIENTDDHVAMEISAAALRNCSTTADFCGMIFDTDQTTDVWYLGASNNGTEGTPVAATGSLAPEADTYFYVSVQTDTAGNVLFYYGTSIRELKPVGILPTAIAYTSANLLAPYVGFIARDTNAQVCTVSRIVTWQDN